MQPSIKLISIWAIFLVSEHPACELKVTHCDCLWSLSSAVTFAAHALRLQSICVTNQSNYTAAWPFLQIFDSFWGRETMPKNQFYHVHWARNEMFSRSRSFRLHEMLLNKKALSHKLYRERDDPLKQTSSFRPNNQHSSSRGIVEKW